MRLSKSFLEVFSAPHWCFIQQIRCEHVARFLQMTKFYLMCCREKLLIETQKLSSYFDKNLLKNFDSIVISRAKKLKINIWQKKLAISYQKYFLLRYENLSVNGNFAFWKMSQLGISNTQLLDF